MSVLKTTLTILMVLFWEIIAAQNIYVGHISGSSADVSIVGSSALTVTGELTISDQGILYNADTLSVQGNIVNNNSDMTIGTGTLYLTGTLMQTISGVPLNVYDLIFNNTSTGIVLATDLVIGNSAVFVKGILSTDTNSIVFKAGSIYTGASDSSHVSGTVEKIGNTAFTFPVGNDTMLRSVAISAPDQVTDTFSASYSRGMPSNGILDTGINHISTIEKWDINRISGTSEPTVTLSYDSLNSETTYGKDADLRVVSLVDGTWINLGGSGTGGLVTANTTSSSFGEFTLASSTGFNPLPVTLLSFVASYNVDKKAVDLRWSTATEINSDIFIVERSFEGKIWTNIGEMNAAGNSASVLHYQFTDFKPFNSVVFYRLKQVDYDGKFEYSIIQSIVKIYLSADFQLYPNPVKSNATLKYWADINEKYQLEIINPFGQVLLSKEMFLGKGENTINLNLESLPPGHYVFKMYSTTSSDKFVIKKITKL